MRKRRTVPKMTAADVLSALRDAYGISTSDLHTEEWAMLTEVPLRAATVYGNIATGYANERRIDAFLVRNWSGKPHRHERIAVEVKVSRSDFHNETDSKRAPAYASAHRAFYAAPVGMLDPEEMPDGWGLIDVYETPQDAAAATTGRLIGAEHLPVARMRRCRVRVPAKRHEPSCDLDYLVSAMARIGSRLDERIRRGESDAARVANLADERDRLLGQVSRAQDAVKRERDRLRAARSALAALDGSNVCLTCGEPIQLKPNIEWAHADREQDVACYGLRAEEQRRRLMAETGAHYYSALPLPVLPKALASLAEVAPSDA